MEKKQVCVCVCVCVEEKGQKNYQNHSNARYL